MGIRYMQLMVIDTEASRPSSADIGQIIYCADTKISFVWDGTQWQTTYKVVVKRAMVTINGKTPGTTPIYTLEPGTLNFHPTQIIMRPVSIVSATLKPTVSIGSNATADDNIATGSLLNSVLTLTGATTSPHNASTSPALAGGTVIYANVSLGALPTSYTFKVNVIGFYDA